MSKKLPRFVALSLMAAFASLMLTMPAKAAVITNTTVPIAPFFVLVPCANGGLGDVVSLTGDLHVLITMTINGNSVSGGNHQ